MNQVLVGAVDKASSKRDWMVQQAKEKGPTAAFYVGLVTLSQAIDRARNTSGQRHEVAESMRHLRDVSADIDLRYKAENRK